MTNDPLFPSIAVALAVASASADPVALSQFSFDAPQHAKPVDGAIWYPAAGEGAEEIHAENAVFRGVSTQRDAQIAQGEHPFVLLSHGFGGGIRSMAWLARSSVL